MRLFHQENGYIKMLTQNEQNETGGLVSPVLTLKNYVFQVVKSHPSLTYIGTSDLAGLVTSQGTSSTFRLPKLPY